MVIPVLDLNKCIDILSKLNIKPPSKIKVLSKRDGCPTASLYSDGYERQKSVLDEPTLGLDLVYRKDFTPTMRNYYEGNKTILIQVLIRLRKSGVLSMILYL